MQTVIPKEDVQWVVNDNAELGVKIYGQFYFLYKGESLQYLYATHDDETPIKYRPVGKREFGECCKPIGLSSFSGNYTAGSGWKQIDETLKDKTTRDRIDDFLSGALDDLPRDIIENPKDYIVAVPEIFRTYSINYDVYFTRFAGTCPSYELAVIIFHKDNPHTRPQHRAVCADYGLTLYL